MKAAKVIGAVAYVLRMIIDVIRALKKKKGGSNGKAQGDKEQQSA